MWARIRRIAANVTWTIAALFIVLAAWYAALAVAGRFTNPPEWVEPGPMVNKGSVWLNRYRLWLGEQLHKAFPNLPPPRDAQAGSVGPVSVSDGQPTSGPECIDYWAGRGEDARGRCQ